jgi:CheY-like chemotaxis protein
MADTFLMCGAYQRANLVFRLYCIIVLALLLVCEEHLEKQWGIRRFMSSKAKILVVDDQVAVAAMIRFLLTRAGCETQGALDAKTALRLAQTQVFDLITLDVEMPGTSGFDLFRRLRQIPRLTGTPIVFVAGNASIENQQRGLDLGAVDFIEKSFDTQDFLFRILSHTNAKLCPSDVPDENPDTDTQSLCNTP